MEGTAFMALASTFSSTIETGVTSYLPSLHTGGGGGGGGGGRKGGTTNTKRQWGGRAVLHVACLWGWALSMSLWHSL